MILNYGSDRLKKALGNSCRMAFTLCTEIVTLKNSQ